MEKTQLKENKKVSNNKNISSGGLISQMIINSPLMQRKAKEQQDMFGDNAILQKKENKTGLPNNLKSGMENLSGINLDSVKVHYNSSKPASVQAHAFAQGSDIHLALGQEKHLPHELGHVVQQAKGQVKPTTTVGGVAVNDSPKLESEATKMGSKALQMKEQNFSSLSQLKTSKHINNTISLSKQDIIQKFPYAITHSERGRNFMVEYNSATILLYEIHPLDNKEKEIGWIKMRYNDDDKFLELKTISVNDSKQGQGLGQVLVNMFARFARDKGITNLRVLLANGHGLYKSCGFIVNPDDKFDIKGETQTVLETSKAIIKHKGYVEGYDSTYKQDYDLDK